LIIPPKGVQDSTGKEYRFSTAKEYKNSMGKDNKAASWKTAGK
jgi:hypothetical protein